MADFGRITGLGTCRRSWQDGLPGLRQAQRMRLARERRVTLAASRTANKSEVTTAQVGGVAVAISGGTRRLGVMGRVQRRIRHAA